MQTSSPSVSTHVRATKKSKLYTAPRIARLLASPATRSDAGQGRNIARSNGFSQSLMVEFVLIRITDRGVL
jgi:hypothetical protein